MPTNSAPSSRRRGCWFVLAVGALTPGVALLGAGAWVRAQGGGSAVLRVGGAALVLGVFVIVFIGSALRRSTRRDAESAEDAPSA